MTPSRLTAIAGAALAVLSVFAPAVRATAKNGPPPVSRCTDNRDASIRFDLEVGDEIASGHYSLPGSAPTALVVIGHGYGHSSYSWIEHMKTMSRELNVIAVAMDYRGTEFEPKPWPKDGVPTTRGWRVMEGAEDSIAAAKLFQADCPSAKTTVILGVSMGGNATGLAVALASQEENAQEDPLFDYWIDAEGANNVIETYHEARAVGQSGNEFAVNAYEDIKEEMGGQDFEQNPAPYLEHSVVARIDEIAASGVKGVIAIQGLNDGLVPYNQSRELVAELVGAGVPVDMYTAVRNAEGAESGTTLTGNAGQDPGLAGHASERSTTHAVMTTAFAQLKNILIDGYEPGPYNEFIFDSGNVYPAP